MVAAKLANMTNSEAGKLGAEAQGKASANLQTPPVSQSDAAKLLNVSTRSVAAATKVKDGAAGLGEGTDSRKPSITQRCAIGHSREKATLAFIKSVYKVLTRSHKTKRPTPKN